VIPLDEALRIIAREAEARRLGSEVVPIEDALGRVLAADAAARINLPPFDKSAMDGFAVPDDEPASSYVLDGVTPAGELRAEPLRTGHCQKVMTGAPVPPGTARVVMVEDTRTEGSVVHMEPRGGKTNICIEGEDVRRGDLLYARGATIDPLAMANLAAAGAGEVEVSKRPRVGVVSTGDELLEPGEPWAEGRIYDANGPLLAGLLRSRGLEPSVRTRLVDDPGETESGVARALEASDVVIMTGAVSAGDFDYVPDALGRLGLVIHFSAVATKPGKPVTFATSADKVVFGLPGNPVSAFVTFHLYAWPALMALQGAKVLPLLATRIAAAPVATKPDRRTRFLPARLLEDGRVEPLDYHGSAHLQALAASNGFVVVPGDTPPPGAGESVTFWPLAVTGYAEEE
jgi:molybdopterin molybdotransferase